MNFDILFWAAFLFLLAILLGMTLNRLRRSPAAPLPARPGHTPKSRLQVVGRQPPVGVYRLHKGALGGAAGKFSAEVRR